THAASHSFPTRRSSDLDDAFSAGLLTAGQIAESVSAYARILDELEMQFPGASGRERFQESVRRLIDLLVTGLIEGTAQAAAQSRSEEHTAELQSRGHPV